VYVPPALRSDGETSYESQQCVLWSQNVRRDLPPHRDPPQSPLRRSDNSNWRAPSPNCPITFWSPPASPQLPASPANSPPASPTHLFRPKIPPATPQHHLESKLGSELISLIKATSNALQGIALVAEKLIRRVNAERRLTHKSQRMTWSSHVETQCAFSPLCFFLGGGYL